MSALANPMGYLTAYLDMALPIIEGETKDSITKEEHERLCKLISVATEAQQIPRRLGAEAMPDELAEDKRTAKRIQHVAAQCLVAWGGKPRSIEASREAAQVEWARWWNDHRLWLETRQRYVATWCFKNNGDERWAKSVIVKLQNEVKWLEYVLG